MSDKLVELTVNNFVETVASAAPAPGGGSVAALAGAQGAGLMAMVCRLTIGKKKYLDVQEQVEEGLAELDRLVAEFMRLVDADTEAFNAFGAAMAMPKETDEQKAARRTAMQLASKLATEVPAETMAASSATIRLIHRLHPIANKNCLSDMGVAMQMTLTALSGAAMNVLINLPGTGDEEFNKKYAEQVQTARDEAEQLAQETTAAVFAALTS